ncbi:NRT2 ribosyltransferase, partial [Falcunculus frontatus]|nr:NRT2 ribosyltransferase [Falcunculus frontatus]
WPLPSMAPLAHTLALLAMTVATAAITTVSLDVALDSFDDQYRGCRDDMVNALPALNLSEFQQNPLFAQGWAEATAEWQKKGSPGSPLSSPQAIALMAYTMDDLHEEFDAAVREAGRSPQEYRDNFHFKTLHFLLTDALATLRGAQGPQCHCVLRGLDGSRFEAQPGDTVRFGQFASTSRCRDTSRVFGMDTAFQLQTCHGADIREFSFDPGDKEVLIPPYETFVVTEVAGEGDKAQIQLRSTGTFSTYNCEWLRGDIMGTTWGGG